MLILGLGGNYASTRDCRGISGGCESLGDLSMSIGAGSMLLPSDILTIRQTTLTGALSQPEGNRSNQSISAVVCGITSHYLWKKNEHKFLFKDRCIFY